MDKQKVIIAAVLFLLIISIAAFGTFKLIQNNLQEPPLALNSPLPSSGFSAISTPKPTPLALSTQPQTGFDTVEVKNIGITIENVISSTTVNSPLTVKGKANVFEGQVVLEIKDANGKILGKSTATACMGLDACPYEATITFSKPQTAYGTIEAYSPSAKDGSKLYTQTIPVNF